MFTIPKVNVIQSDEGFAVEVLGPSLVGYSEYNKHLLIKSEYLTGPSGLVIYARSLKSWEDGTIVGEADKNRIVDNVRRAFRHRGIEIEVD